MEAGSYRQLASPERDPRPGRPEIRPHRHPRRRTPLLIAAAALAAGLAAAPALAQEEPAPTDAPATSTTAVPGAAAPTAPAFKIIPEPVEAGPNVRSYPRWLPLRRDLPGGEVKVGCTLDSHGSQHGYECSGHHSRWAIDFIAETGTPVYAAGAGFATDLTGKPGGSGFGNVISIDHGFGITTLYAHLSEAFVPPEGMWVDETTLLGKVGRTGSASTPHLHFEEFDNPGGSNSRTRSSIDPGPLFGCRGDLLVSFPQVAGFDSWAGLPWGSLTVASDGDACVTEASRATAVANDLIPDATTTDARDDDAPGRSERTDAPATADEPDADDGPGRSWADILAPLLNLVGSTGERLQLPS